VITPVAGTGELGSDGDEGPATAARIQAGSVVVGNDGELYVDDVNRIRMIDPDGIIHAFAGTGTAGFSGDGGPALQAQLADSAGPSAVAADGSLIIGDPSNMRIRRVDPTGMIETVVGSGERGTAGDGGAATEASLMPSPYGVAIAPDGTIYFSDWQAGRVRKVDPEGVITTVAGGGQFDADFGDCGPATDASLVNPQAISLQDGSLFIVDGGHNLIRLVVSEP
jgi:serine/threonine-protein kinase